MSSINRVVVGLGNPGERFVGTRHNLGIETVQEWVTQEQPEASWRLEDRFEALMTQLRINDVSVVCLFPQTFMNDSGRAVAACMAYYQIDMADVLIVHDDIELPLGEVALVAGGSARGHNGVRSIHQTLKSQDIARLRLGVGRPTMGEPVDQYVLQRFLSEQQSVVAQMREAAREHLSAWVTQLPLR